MNVEAPGVASSKSRRRVSFTGSDAVAAGAGPSTGPDEGTGAAYYEEEISDGEVEAYLRTDEEVEVFRALFEAREAAAPDDRSGPQPGAKKKRARPSAVGLVQ